MATTTRGRKAGATTTKKRSASTTRAKRPTTRSRKPATTLETVRETAGGYTGNLVKTIRARPYAAAVIAAGTAGAAAFLWAKRALIGDQASVIRDKASELRDQAADQAVALREQAGERAKSFKGKLNERFTAVAEATGIDAELDAQRGRGRGKKLRRVLAEEALSLKQLGDSDPIVSEQSKVGAVAY